VKISSWGQLSQLDHDVKFSKPDYIGKVGSFHGETGIPFGLGRSYGDACLNPEATIWKTTDLSHYCHFDEEAGLLECEAGISLGEIQKLIMPRGWNLPVVPGSQFVTVGGAIANDVHGKSHHRYGSFGNNVVELTLLRSDATTIICSPTTNVDWFCATVGGIGLTVLIIKATLKLIRSNSDWLEVETIAFKNLDRFFELSEESASNWENTVAWVDCVGSKAGRGIFIRGNPAPPALGKKIESRKLSIPFTPPFSLINRLTLRAFNSAYYFLNSRKSAKSVQSYQSFFYPLDAIGNWNRSYGTKGFYQYQSVIPLENAKIATKAMLAEIARSKEGSFLAVLKVFGTQIAVGMLSFPMPE
jgi:FAD/FMN-containing dehydrogenase